MCDAHGKPMTANALSARGQQELGRHSDLSATQRYRYVSPLAIEAAIRQLGLPATRVQVATALAAISDVCG